MISPVWGERLYSGNKAWLWLLPVMLYGVGFIFLFICTPDLFHFNLNPQLYAFYYTMPILFSGIYFAWFFNPHGLERRAKERPRAFSPSLPFQLATLMTLALCTTVPCKISTIGSSLSACPSPIWSSPASSSSASRVATAGPRLHKKWFGGKDIKSPEGQINVSLPFHSHSSKFWPFPL
jgi:hypothetical protein